MKGSSVILIGMPGSGKSTLGILLAKELGLDFVDTDVLIQVQQHKTLQQILDETNYLKLREIEEQVILEMDLPDTVISTGGSVVYGHKAMRRLGKAGPLVYLRASIETLRKRIHNYESRGIAKQPNQTFVELFAERTKLYEHYAHLRINCDEGTPEQILSDICTQLAAL